MAAEVIRLGVLSPHVTPGPKVEFAAMAPGRVAARIAQVGSTEPASAEALRAHASPAHLNRAAEQLRNDSIQTIGYASTTTAYVIGGDAEYGLMAHLYRHTGLPVASTCACAVRALRVLGIQRVALIGAPWFQPDYNQLGAAYFTSHGLDVVSSASADLPRDPDAIKPAAIVEWVARHVDVAAQAVFIGGNGFRAADAIDALEATIGRPVLTANQVLLWQLLDHIDATCAVTGYGQLFTHKP